MGRLRAKRQSHEVNFYNLDVIISVGYRVKSLRGTQFRQWATKRLKEYIVKGFTMDDDRLKKLGGYIGSVLQEGAEQDAFCRARADCGGGHL